MNTIFITGGSAGIGAATVGRFLSEGWNVSFMDTDTENARKLAEGLGRPEHLMFTEGSIRSRDDLRRAVEATVARFGSINSLFANAGIHRSNTITDISDDELHTMVDTNIYGTIHTIQAVIPSMKTAGGGSIVINCSDQWFVGKPHSFGYGLTKGALGQITRSLAIDLAPMNIRVNAVCPGTIHTPLVDRVFDRCVERGESLDRLWKEENALFLRGSVGRPDEVAAVVWFLASDQSSFCTGAHYLVDGGLVAQ